MLSGEKNHILYGTELEQTTQKILLEVGYISNLLLENTEIHHCSLHTSMHMRTQGANKTKRKVENVPLEIERESVLYHQGAADWRTQQAE